MCSNLYMLYISIYVSDNLFFNVIIICIVNKNYGDEKQMNSFEDKLNYYRNLEIDKKKFSNRLSLMRLAIFAAGVLVTINFTGGGYKGKAFLSVICFGLGFIFTVIKHDSVIRELENIKCRILVNERYIKRRGDSWLEFQDMGDEFVDAKHQYASDLDIFGRGSLFQWINIAHTYFGREHLKNLLKIRDDSIRNMKERQKAVKELSTKLEFCQELECLGMLAKGIGKNPEDLITYSQNKKKLISRRWMYNIFYIIPFITIMSLALYLLKYRIPVRLIIALLLLQMFITAIGSLKTNEILNRVNPFKASIDAYINIIRLIEKEEFESDYLKNIKSRLRSKNKPASYGIKKLGKIADKIDMRYNALAYILLNSLLLWDFHCIIALEEWRKDYGCNIEDWIRCIGECEALASMAVICQTDSKWVFPEYNTDGLAIVGEELGHPLINPLKRVSNDVSIKNNICIITGSNMSGKTTLLRTIGISLVLAYAGAPVYAKAFKCSVMEIFTSMRIEDDLNSGISTFYAELLRVKKIIEFSARKEPMLFLIDEIFKGTNSRDRLTGAVSLIHNLNRSWIIGLISTHDFELCDLENKDKARIMNYHFSESYTKNEILFDYKLKTGRCATTNAKYLMRMVGIEIEE